jgi:hypothetical protein
MKEAFNKLCTPAKIYFAIAVIMSIVELFNGIGILSISIKLVFAFIWTFILGWMCKKGYKSISWFLVALPYIILLLDMFGIYKVTREGFRFPYGWNDQSKNINNKNNCLSKCRDKAQKRGDELNNMSNDPMWRTNPEYRKIAKENRRLQTDCNNNCGLSLPYE